MIIIIILYCFIYLIEIYENKILFLLGRKVHFIGNRDLAAFAMSFGPIG